MHAARAKRPSNSPVSLVTNLLVGPRRGGAGRLAIGESTCSVP